MNKISTKKITVPFNTKIKEEIANMIEFPYEPGNNVIDNILNYSKALSIRKSKSDDYFELVLN